MTKYIIPFLVLIGYGTDSLSQNTDQQVLAAAGDDVISQSTQLSWTLGQPFAASSINSAVVLVEGFQQSEVITIPLNASPQNQVITIYPNPAADFIQLNTSDNQGIGSYSLQSLKGEILLEEKAINFMQHHEIDLTSYARGVYLLTVNMQGASLQTFKIIKK